MAITAKQILAQLKSLGDEKVRAHNTKYGAGFARQLSIICRVIRQTPRPAVCPTVGVLSLRPFRPLLSLSANTDARIADTRSVNALRIIMPR